MAVAKFLEGKCATVAHLPPAILYQLCAQSAPADVVEAVVAASTTETPMPAHEIAERLAGRAKKRRKFSRKSPGPRALSREEAKAQRAKRKADRDAADAARKRREAKRDREEEEARQRKVGREERITRVIENIAKTLTDENLVDLVDTINDVMVGRPFIISILQAEQNSRIPPPEDKPIVPTIDPTDWQNKRDYCLTNTAGLTGAQQTLSWRCTVILAPNNWLSWSISTPSARGCRHNASNSRQ